MAYTIWSVITWLILPTGSILAICILSGFEVLELLAEKISKLDVQLGPFQLSFPVVTCIICSLCFGGEWLALTRLRNQREKTLTGSLDLNDAWRGLVWRHQRNWWLSLSSLILWLIVWRLTSLVCAFRHRCKALQKQKLDLLKQQANARAKRTEMTQPEVILSKSSQEKKTD